MNIQQAIQQLEMTVRSYTARDSFGAPVIPIAAQRPVYLLGAPGLGKTAIVGQVAERLGIGLVSYTMTHHTRQSALGLPQLRKSIINGHEVTLTEYTMPELFAGIHRCVAQTGTECGILFLDEINCVSETLMPAMLELLQKKRFGQYPLPEGWIIVCAGNPEKYNRSAHAFDPVTLDRLRVIEIESDLESWLSHAAIHGVHDAVRGYLLLRPDELCFTDGDSIVSPRSWTDLSDMLIALEHIGEMANRELFAQYLQCAKVCNGFSLYFSLCRGISDQFFSNDIFLGKASTLSFRGKPFDEQLCGISLLSGALIRIVQQTRRKSDLQLRLRYFADGVLSEKEIPLMESCERHLDRMRKAYRIRKDAGLLSPESEAAELSFFDTLSTVMENIASADDKSAALKGSCCCEPSDDSTVEACRNAITFALNAFDNTHALVILKAELCRCDAVASVLKKDAATEFEALLEKCDPNRRAEKLKKELE